MNKFFLIFFIILRISDSILAQQDTVKKSDNKKKYIELFKRPYIQVLHTENILMDDVKKNFFAFFAKDSFEFLSLGNVFLIGTYQIESCTRDSLILVLNDSIQTTKLLVKVEAGEITMNIPQYLIHNLDVNYVSVDDFQYIIRSNYRSFLKLPPIKYDNRGNALPSELPTPIYRYMLGQQDVATLRKIAENRK